MEKHNLAFAPSVFSTFSESRREEARKIVEEVVEKETIKALRHLRQWINNERKKKQAVLKDFQHRFGNEGDLIRGTLTAFDLVTNEINKLIKEDGR